MKDVQQNLDRLTPEPKRMSDWDAVLRDARPHRRSLMLQLAVATGVAALAALFVSAPWKDAKHPGVLDRALAAVGDEAVLHVVLETEPKGDPLVYVDTGRPVTTSETTEIWFDESRGLRKTVSRINGIALDEMLETPDGGFTQGGPIYTCKWIADHPAEAAKARVSCPGGVDPNQSTAPTLDPALAGFVDHYRAALASGTTRRIPGNQVGGRDVIWIEFGSGRSRERVALDRSSYTPVLISATEWSARVRMIEAMPYEPRLFSRPKPVLSFIGSGEVSERELADAGAAPALLGGRAFWLGREWRGLRLTSVERIVWMARSGRSSERQRIRGLNVRLTYSNAGDTGPSLVQSRNGITSELEEGQGELHFVALGAYGELQHYVLPPGGAWTKVATFGGGAQSGPCMIEGAFAATDELTPGNLELCVARNAQIEHWWRNHTFKTWQKSATFGSDVRCVIGMLQGSIGYNLELIVERLDLQYQHYWRDGAGWHQGVILPP